MKQVEILAIVPKDNHEAFTCWFFADNDIELAYKILKERFPNNTHEIIKTLAEEYESIQEQDAACFNNESWE